MVFWGVPIVVTQIYAFFFMLKKAKKKKKKDCINMVLILKEKEMSKCRKDSRNTTLVKQGNDNSQKWFSLVTARKVIHVF